MCGPPSLGFGENVVHAQSSKCARSSLNWFCQMKCKTCKWQQFITIYWNLNLLSSTHLNLYIVRCALPTSQRSKSKSKSNVMNLCTYFLCSWHVKWRSSRWTRAAERNVRFRWISFEWILFLRMNLNTFIGLTNFQQTSICWRTQLFFLTHSGGCKWHDKTNAICTLKENTSRNELRFTCWPA